jgi:hypothetical protein
MGSSKVKALIEITKVAVSIAVGYGMYYTWINSRGDMDPEYYAIIAGAICSIMSYTLLKKLSKGAPES